MELDQRCPSVSDLFHVAKCSHSPSQGMCQDLPFLRLSNTLLNVDATLCAFVCWWTQAASTFWVLWIMVPWACVCRSSSSSPCFQFFLIMSLLAFNGILHPSVTCDLQ
jgi:hypothetical protein